MTSILLLVGGAVSATAVIGLVASFSWYLEMSIYEPLTNYDMARHTRVSGAINNFWSTLFSLLFLLPTILLSAISGVVANVAANLSRLAFLVFFLLAGMAIMQYHHEMYRAELIISQCIVMPFCNHFLFPLLNIARICFNAGIILWDFGYDLYAFYEWGPVLIFLKCTIHTTDATDLFGYLTNVFLVFSQDLVAWFNAGFMTADFDIVNTLDALGLFVQTLVSPLTCLCRALDFLYNAVAMWARLPSLHAALNCALNFFVKLAQIPINTVMQSPHRPNFEEATLRACCTLGQTATTLEYTVLLIVEVLWGVFTNAALPLTIHRILSVRWVHIFSEPLCGVSRLVNMSLTAVVHYDELAQSTGIAYFQFGHVIDEFKESAHYIASVFTLLNNDAQALVDQSLLVLLNLIAFGLEWVLGNIYYWLYGGPLPLYPSAPFGSHVNFLRYYFPDYWLKPQFDNLAATGSTYVYHTALDEFFSSAFQMTQAMGNLFANLLSMDPLGGIIQHTLNIVLCTVRVVANLTSFIFTIITFNSDIRTTMRKVDVDCIFDEMYFLAGSLGDFSRQFATPSNTTGLVCEVDASGSQYSFFCCLGNLIERLFDVMTIGAQQTTHFVQDLITLPTGNIIFCLAFLPYNHSQADRCLRTPDLSTALYLLDASLCDFTCALFSLIPHISAFKCSFPLPAPPPDAHTPPQSVKPCNSIPTCVGLLACRVLRLFLVPMVVTNNFVAKTLGGASYVEYTEMGKFVMQVFCDIIADVLAAVGLLINCTLCAFVHSGTNCDDSIYQLMVSLGILIRFLPLILTTLSQLVVKLILVFVIGIFTGDPIGAVIKFIVGLLTDLFGGLGVALVNFLAKFFNAIGLGFIGDFIKILWRGFCPLLQLLLNAIIVVLKIITFGAIQINFVDFCCDGSPDCQPSQRRRFDQQLSNPSVIDGTLHVNLDNWIAATVQLVQWDTTNPCNQSMSTYAGYAWNNLTEWEQNDVLYCLMKPYWNIRTDNQTVLANSTCDVMIMEYNNTSWYQVDVLSRRTIIDCMYSRIYVDAVRNGVGVPWLPSDILTNPYRKYVFGAEFARGLLIYWQYFSDKTATSDTFVSPTYQTNWATLGLYTGFYANVTTPDQILQFRDHYRLVDYFAWNNASQYEAVDAVSIGFWNFSSLVLTKLSEVINAKSADNTLKPESYLMYSYTLDSAASGVTASVYGIITEAINVAQNITAFWSNPQNVKKRSNAYTILQEGGAGMWRSAVDQLTMMGVDYRMARLNESRYWAGNCSAAEAEQFMDEYDQWVRHDERSWAYHLSRWWDDNKETMLTPHPIAKPRDGQRRIAYNQSQFLFSYVEPRTGREIGESGRQRINRLASALNTGSERSNSRWNALGRLVTLVKERVYVNVIRRNSAFAVEYINRVFVKGGDETDTAAAAAAANEEEEDAVLLEEYYTKTSTNTDKVWQRAVSRTKSAVEQQRLAAQHLHCGRAENIGDGFCADYRAPPPTRRAPSDAPAAATATYRETAAYTRSGGRQYEIANRREPTVTALSGRRHTPGVLWHPHSFVNSIRGSHFVGASLVAVDSFIDLTCYTNITFDNSTLCDYCFIVDQALGRVETGLAWVEEYYTGGQYQQSLNVSLTYFEYAADDTAYAVVGDGPDLSVHGFPGYDGTWWYNLRYLGDNTPNKTRFSDVAALIGAALGDNSTTCNSTGSSGAVIFGSFLLDYHFLNGWVSYAVLLIVGGVVTLFLELVAFLSGYEMGCAGSSDFGTFLIDWFFLCDWLTGEDFRGIRKRFSVGETILMFSVGWIVVTLSFQATIGFSLLSLVTYSGLSVMVTFSFFRSISNNFSFLCLPGLDAMLADDLFYFLVHTVMSKCSWFLAFLIKNPEYDNQTCTACANAGGWDILNCATELGFGDIFANLIFMAQFYAPGSLQWVRESQFPLVSIFYQIPYVNQRINQFADVDMSDRTTYAQYMGCNYIITLFWNFFFLAVFLYFLSIVGPVFYGIVLVGVALANLTYSFYVMFNLISQDTFMSRTTAPFTRMGLVDTPVAEHVDEVESDRPDDGYRFTTTAGTNYSAPRQMRTRYTYDSHSVFNFSTLYNVTQRMWDNLFHTDRKQR